MPQESKGGGQKTSRRRISTGGAKEELKKEESSSSSNSDEEAPDKVTSIEALYFFNLTFISSHFSSINLICKLHLLLLGVHSFFRSHCRPFI